MYDSLASLHNPNSGFSLWTFEAKKEYEFSPCSVVISVKWISATRRMKILRFFFLFNCTEFGTESSVWQSYDVGTFRQLACSSGPLGGLRIKGDRSPCSRRQQGQMTRKDPLRQLWRIYIIVCVNFFQQMGLRFKSCATRSRQLLRWWISYRYNISISRRVYYLHNGGQLNYSTNLVDYLSTYVLAAWIIHADDSW